MLNFFRAIESLPQKPDGSKGPFFDPERGRLEAAISRGLVAAAVLLIAVFALAGIAQAGKIFEQWDAVVSWNRWAVDWAANRLPYATSMYPQLLPTNISVSYVFLQSSQIWIFAKAFQFLFCLMLLIAMLDAARVEGRFGYVLGVPITYALLVALLRYRMLSSGYVDVPLAFFGWVSVYSLSLARNAGDAIGRRKFLFIGALLAFGAAATKQNGLYIAAMYPLLAWRLVLRGEGPGSLRRHLPLLAGLCLILGLTISPWYLYKFFDFQAGGDRNNTALLLTDFHQQRDLLERLFYAGSTIVEAVTPWGAALALIALAVSLRDPIQRWLLGTLVAPLGLVWAFAFSYDLRNLAVIVPFVGAAAGAGLMQIAAWASKLGASWAPAQGDIMRRQSPPPIRPDIPGARPLAPSAAPSATLRVGHCIGLMLLLLFAVSLCISDERLLLWQQQQQRMVGVPDLNRELYAYAADDPQALIATDYQAMRWLPELGERSVVCTCHELSAFRQTFDRPEVRYVLVRTEGAAREVREFLQDHAAAQLLFENHGFAFYGKRAVQVAQVAQETDPKKEPRISLRATPHWTWAARTRWAATATSPIRCF
jgi:hypothetical protein